MEISRLFDQPSKLPTVPKVVQELIASFGADDVSIDQIAQQIAADPSLTAKLLRLANSAYFHVSRTVGTVDDALRMLGFVMVRNLVLGNGMVAAFRNTAGLNLPQFWRYNLYAACAARWLAARSETNADLVFTVGLLHGIGELHMHACMPAEMAPLDKQLNVLDAGRAELEQKTLGFHYGDVTAGLAKSWHFPDAMIEALRGVPQPLAAPAFSEPAGWVALGAWRARVEVLGLDDAAALACYPKQLAKRLGVAPDWTPALAVQSAASPDDAMPPLTELTLGLDAMVE